MSSLIYSEPRSCTARVIEPVTARVLMLVCITPFSNNKPPFYIVNLYNLFAFFFFVYRSFRRLADRLGWRCRHSFLCFCVAAEILRQNICRDAEMGQGFCCSNGSQRSVRVGAPVLAPFLLSPPAPRKSGGDCLKSYSCGTSYLLLPTILGIKIQQTPMAAEQFGRVEWGCVGLGCSITHQHLSVPQQFIFLFLGGPRR